MAVLRHPGWPAVTVTVRYFAGAQAAAGLSEEKITLAGTPTVGTLVEELVSRHGEQLARVLAASSYIVDEVASGPEQALTEGAQVDVLPPFAGG